MSQPEDTSSCRTSHELIPSPPPLSWRAAGRAGLGREAGPSGGLAVWRGMDFSLTGTTGMGVVVRFLPDRVPAEPPANALRGRGSGGPQDRCVEEGREAMCVNVRLIWSRCCLAHLTRQ